MYYIEHLDIGKPVKLLFTHKNRHSGKNAGGNGCSINSKQMRQEK